MRARTNPEGVVSDIIIDNPQATVVGSWTLTSFAPNRYGPDYRYRSAGSGANHLKFTPTILREGNYRVFEWHSHGSNRATDAPHVITYNGGVETIVVDQQEPDGGGQWNELGMFNFAAGTGGHVKITDAFTSPSPGVVIADAIKFVYVPYPPLAPSNLSAVALDSSQIDLKWNDNSTNEDNFIISRSLNPAGPFEDIDTLSKDSTNYTDIELTESTQYFYHVRGANVGGDSDLSNQANATTDAGLPVIVTHPLSQTTTEGQNVDFFVDVRAKAPTYQWQFNGIDIPGATTSSLGLTNVSGVHDGEYRVIISNPFVVTNLLAEPVFSDTAILRLNFFVTVTSTLGGTFILTPEQTDYAFNENLLVTAVPTNGVFIGWSGDILDTNITTSLVMNRSYHITANFMPTSDLIVDDPEAELIGSWTASGSTSEKYGSSFFYTTGSLAPTSEAVYTPNIIYPGSYNIFIWYSGGNTRTTSMPLFISHNGGSASMTINQTTNGGGWRQIAAGKTFAVGTSGYVRISNDTGETNKLVIADAFLFSLVNPPIIIMQPESMAIDAGEAATFSVLASGTALTYQWRHQGTNIPGATGISHAVPSAQASNSGNYEVVLSNETGSLTSTNATLTVNVIPARLGSMERLPDKRFRFVVTGSPGNYVFEASTNLSSWVPLTNLSTTNGVIQFIDHGSTNLPRRFYRTRQNP